MLFFRVHIQALVLLVVLCSCVGTIEDKNPAITKPAEVSRESVAFNGLSRAIPISNARVELYFNPASGNPDSLTYLIYINNSSSPIEVKGGALESNPIGEYRYTVTGLFTNTLYQFRVGVRNALSGEQSENDKSLSARTFSNITATFNGASSAEAAPGIDGRTSIIVKWIPAVTLSSSVFSPRITDPIAYEVRYMSATDGNVLSLNEPGNPNVTTQILPNTVNSTTNGSSERERQIPGLEPDTQYYFQVRAIHKSWGGFKDDPSYLYEKNTRIVSARTRSLDEQFDFNGRSLSVLAPPGQDGVSRADLKWTSAVGPYVHYRLYHQLAAPAHATEIELDQLTDPYDSDSINLLNEEASNYTIVSPGAVSHRLTNLTSYAYYHIKLVACLSIQCTATERQVSDLVLYRVVPQIAAFEGITAIQNPVDVNNLDRLNLDFEPAVTTVGVLNALEVYCYSSIDDDNPILVPIGSTIVDGTKENCDGLGRLTANPANIVEYANFDTIEINGVRFVGATTENNYCLAVIPAIINANYTERNFENAVVKCTRPELSLPSVNQFPGAIEGCIVTSDTINVRWLQPEGGLYSNFKVFWKEVDGSPFKFSEAIEGTDLRYFNNELGTAANTVVLGASDLSYVIGGLTPGKRIQYGVLAYVETSPGELSFSEFNQAPRECSLPLPRATFGEWVHISAIGPKENGLVPYGASDRFLLETFDEDGTPIEVQVDPGLVPTEEFEAQFGARAGNIEFNGAYGSLNANSTAGEKHMYSNSGMVQLVWKDVVVDGTSPINLGALIPANELDDFYQKSNRTTGYKVYRSDDGMNSWVDLTASDYEFQTIGNAGLLQPTTMLERARSNRTADSFSGVVFTDYSVRAFDYRSLVRNDYDRVDRARIYYYKIVPVLVGLELNYVDDGSSKPQNIIRITVPPRNQALVHRLIANRQTCREMGREHSGDVKSFYTCEYNGVGSRSLNVPWRSEEMLYDVGGDVLVDRFEVGCSFSRGDLSNSKSLYSGSTGDNLAYDFYGLNDEASAFKGCLQSNYRADISSFGDFSPTGPGFYVDGNTPSDGMSFDSYNSVLTGDCFGRDTLTLYTTSTICANPQNVGTNSYTFPGARNSSANPDAFSCETANNLLQNYFSLFNDTDDVRAGAISRIQTQSEFAGVYHNSNLTNSQLQSRGVPQYRSGSSRPFNDSSLVPSSDGMLAASCFVNLPLMDEGDGSRLKPRWFPVNKLSSLVYRDINGANESTVNLLTMTLDEILNDFRMYDDGSVIDLAPKRVAQPNADYINARYTNEPGRITSQTPLSRVFSSNSSKLPLLRGLSQADANKVCSTYEVEVGQLDSGGNYNRLAAPKPKNLMRRKEFVVAAAWDAEMSEASIIELERGERLRQPVDDAHPQSVIVNNSCNTTLRDYPTYSAAGLAAGQRIDPRIFDSRTNPAVFSGSSFYDHEDYNTSLCQSRYGIQDMVGNIAEWGTEVFRCDTGQEQFWLGTRNNPAQSIQISSGTIIDQNLQPWILGNLDSGRCSPVSVGDDRPRRMDENFIPRSFDIGGVFASIFNGLGNLNTDLVLEPWPHDQDGVNQLRNGDGKFFDFGSTGIGSPIDAHDTLALLAPSRGAAASDRYRDGDTRRGLAFSPVLGIPLECAFGSCLDTADNTRFITSGLFTLTGAEVESFDISDFPIGNSDIRSDGLAEWHRTDTWSTNRLAGGPYTYIESVHPGDDPDRILRTRNERDTDVLHTAYRVTYEVPRNARMTFINGGHKTNPRSGRYTTAFSLATASSGSAGSMNDESGTRCSIMINME